MKSEWERLCWKGGVRHVISKRLLFGMYTVSGASGVRKSSHYVSVDVCLIKRTRCHSCIKCLDDKGALKIIMVI